jgi:O-acetyl-ADP-ribose deacetylase (regulator of RNase III)
MAAHYARLAGEPGAELALPLPDPRIAVDLQAAARTRERFGLPARYVIHTVGPVWGGGERGEDRLLANCYRNSLALAAEHGLTSIAFPAISTGVFGFPPDRAAVIALRAVREALADFPSIERVVFCCFGAQSREHHEAAFMAAKDKRQ